MATTFTWDNAAASAWASDHWGRAGVAPKWPGDASSTVGDKVIVATANFPTGGPVAPLTVAEYTCNTSTFSCGVNLTVTAALTMGTALGVDLPAFAGTAAAGCVVLFQGSSNNTGTVGDNATFNDTSVNTATAGDFSIFNDASYNNGTVGDYATYNDATSNNSIAGDYATFNDTSFSGGAAATVGDYATFNDTSYNDGGTVGNYYVINSTDFLSYAVFSIGLTAPLPLASDVKVGVAFGQNQTGTAETSAFGPYPTSTVAVGPFPVGADSIGPYPVV